MTYKEGDVYYALLTLPNGHVLYRGRGSIG